MAVLILGIKGEQDPSAAVAAQTSHLKEGLEILPRVRRLPCPQRLIQISKHLVACITPDRNEHFFLMTHKNHPGIIFFFE